MRHARDASDGCVHVNVLSSGGRAAAVVCLVRGGVSFMSSVADVLSANQRGLLQNGGAGSLADGRHVCERLTRDKNDWGKRHSDATVRRETIELTSES